MCWYALLFRRLWRILTMPICESEWERREREWMEDARALLAEADYEKRRDL